jgi:hypothetical protein
LPNEAWKKIAIDHQLLMTLNPVHSSLYKMLKDATQKQMLEQLLGRAPTFESKQRNGDWMTTEGEWIIEFNTTFDPPHHKLYRIKLDGSELYVYQYEFRGSETGIGPKEVLLNMARQLRLKSTVSIRFNPDSPVVGTLRISEASGKRLGLNSDIERKMKVDSAPHVPGYRYYKHLTFPGLLLD